MEVENNNCLSFLDICIYNNQGSFDTSVYRKQTFTGLGLNYMSSVPDLFKINAIRTLINRAYSHCSTWQFFHDEIKKLGQYFTNNGYPMYLFDNMVRKLLHHKLNPKLPKHLVEKDIRYVNLPFYGYVSYNLRKYLNNLFVKTYPQCDFRFIFTNPNTVSRFFPFKDRIPDLLCSNIVYKFQCSSCNAGYIGSTCRNLKSRIFEHIGRSVRTGSVLSNPCFFGGKRSLTT